MICELKPGDMAPDFDTCDEAGNPLRLSDFRGKTLILFFYPRDNTPGCIKQAQGFQESLGEINKAGAVLLGVSADSAKSHQRFKERRGLEFPLLMDEDHEIAEAYGVWRKKKFMGKEFMGIVRSHFLIGKDGRILDLRIKVSPADSVSLACEALREK